jgi:hypothetical protein
MGTWFPRWAYFSVLLDLPTGATIVCTFGAVLIVMFLIHLLFFHGQGRAWLARPQPEPEGTILPQER